MKSFAFFFIQFYIEPYLLHTTVLRPKKIFLVLLLLGNGFTIVAELELDCSYDYTLLNIQMDFECID